VIGGGGAAELVVVVDVAVEVVGVAAGGDAVSEHEVIARHTAGPSRASRYPDMPRP
jgi:hypothetical protein